MISWDKFYKSPCLTQEQCDSQGSGTTVSERICSALNVFPAAGITDIGGTSPFSAILTYSDGTSEDVSTLATWTSSGIGAIDQSGNFISEEQGIATVNAAYCDLIGSASVQVVGSCMSNPVDWVAACCKASIMDTEVSGRSLFEWQSSAVKALFLNVKENDRSGAVSYSGVRTSMGQTVSYSEDGALLAGLTSDHIAAYLPVVSLHPNEPCLFPSDGGGPSSRCNIQIVGGLRAAWEELKSPRHRNDASRMLVLFVFGADTVPNTAARELATQIKSEGIRIVVVSYNTPINYIPILKEIATCGLFFPVDDPNLIIQAVQGLPQAICYGYASYCYGTVHRDDVVDPPIETASLAGLRWELPCSMPTNWPGCPCVDPHDQFAIMGGDDGAIYDVVLRLRGIIELKNFIGGTRIPVVNQYAGGIVNVGVNKDGTPDAAINGAFNRYSLIVANPPATYWLNEGIAASDGASRAWFQIPVDYEVTVRIAAGSLVTLRANSFDGVEFKNAGNEVIPDVAPYPAAYDGQFLSMTPVSVTTVFSIPDPAVTILDDIAFAYDFDGYTFTQEPGDPVAFQFTDVAAVQVYPNQLLANYPNGVSPPTTPGQSLQTAAAVIITGNYPSARAISISTFIGGSPLNVPGTPGSGATAFSVQLLVKPLWVNPGESGTLLSIGTGWQLIVDDSTHKLLLKLNGTAHEILTQYEFLSGDYLHIVATYSPSGSHKIYVYNETSDILKVVEVNQAFTSSGFIFIGKTVGGTAYGNMHLDSLAVWTRSLSVTEATYLIEDARKQYPFDQP